MEKGRKTLQSVGRSASRRSIRGPSTSPMSHSSDQDRFRDSGLAHDLSNDSILEQHSLTSAHSRASSDPAYPSPSNIQAYSSSGCSSAALTSASLLASAPYSFNPAPVLAPDSRRPSRTYPTLPSFDSLANLGSINRPYSSATYCS